MSMGWKEYLILVVVVAVMVLSSGCTALELEGKHDSEKVIEFIIGR